MVELRKTLIMAQGGSYLIPVDLIHAGQPMYGSSGRVQIPDIRFLRMGQALASARTLFARLQPTLWARALLLFLVAHVVGMGSKKQMLRVRAFGVIASVKDMQIVRNPAEMNDPRDPTCGDFGLSPAQTNHSVSLVLVGCPTPAAFLLDHLAPKALFKCSSLACHEYGPCNGCNTPILQGERSMTK